MRFAHVVPVRRMPADRPWLTYAIPDDMTVESGTLVTIPLRGQPILGVVWQTTDQTPPMKVQNISNAYLSSPVISLWQQQICQAMAETGSTSLGDVLWRIIPKITIRILVKTFTGDLKKDASSSTATHAFSWYRDRQQGLQKILDVLSGTGKNSVVIVTPTHDDAQEIISLAEKLGRIAVHIHGQMPPTIYAKWYNRIRNGEAIIVVGGTSALALPFSKPPQIILDQEEHHAHKQIAQFPYYDSRAVLKHIDVPIHTTTPAPSLGLYHDRHPEIPSPLSHRQLISLHGLKQASLLSDEAMSVFDQLVSEQKKVVCISPRRGYASTTACRACGTVLVCPTCGRSASVFRGLADEARCHSCQTSIPLRTTCLKCGSSDWLFRGYGIEQTVSNIQRLRPEWTVVPTAHPGISADIAVDTYQAYRGLRQIPELGAVLISSGDSLLTSPDYSVAERAWQYLARVQAEVPAAKILVQTFDPESLFWQRWLHGDDRAWYDDELNQRQRLQVPPFSVQWIANFRGDGEIVQKKTQELEKLYSHLVHVRALPQRPSRPNKHRLLITFLRSDGTKKLPWTTLFPLPWHLDQYPTSWLD